MCAREEPERRRRRVYREKWVEKPELLSVNSPEQQRVDDRVEEKLGGGKKN